MKTRAFAFSALMAVLLAAGAAVAIERGNPFPGGGASLGAIATQFCALTGCTMTNTLTFDNATTDITTTGNQNFTVDPAGTGITEITGDMSVSGNFTANVTIAKTTATEVVTNATTGSNTGYAGLQTQTAGTITGRVMWCGNTGCTDTDLQTKVTLIGYGGYFPAVASNTANAAGVVIFSVLDNVTGTAQTVLTVDGEGNLFLQAGATRSKGTITLAAGTGTATVASGSICTCVDTTANASVRCAVASTTLTATGTGADVIAYHCL